jgi:hypothetical protein
MFLSIDGGRSRIYSSGTSQGAHRRCFLCWWWVLLDLRQHLPGSPSSMFLSIDGGYSRMYSSGTSQGTRDRCFLALMVDAPSSTAPTPPREPIVDVS